MATNISLDSLNMISPRCVDAEAAGARKPFVTLPYWLLWLLVRLAVLLSIVFYTIFCGLQILHPKTGEYRSMTRPFFIVLWRLLPLLMVFEVATC